MPKVTLYHGTRDARLTGFSEDGMGTGGDPNCALGVYLTENPADAVRYADPGLHDGGAPARPGGRVLVVEAELSRAFVVTSYNEFFGTDVHGDNERSHDDFGAARRRIAAEGFDCVVTDGCLDEHAGIWCVLDPARLRVGGEMTPVQALEADSASRYDDVGMGGDGILFPARSLMPLGR